MVPSDMLEYSVMHAMLVPKLSSDILYLFNDLYLGWQPPKKL